MKKILLLCLILVCCVALSGCSGGSIIKAASDAVPYEQIPATPPGLVEPEPEGYAKAQSAEGYTVLSGENVTIVCRYGIAPDDSAAAFSEAAASEKQQRQLADQYAEGLAADYGVSVKSFFELPGLLLSGALEQDTAYGKSGGYAAYAVVPYGEHLVMVSAFAPASGDDPAGKVSAFLDAFAIDNAPAPAA